MRHSRTMGAVMAGLFALVFVFALGAQQAQAGLSSVWAVSDCEKIFRGDTDNPMETGQDNAVWDGSSVSLFSAKNEIVAFQLILEADGSGASTVDVHVSDLTNGGHSIRGSHPLPSPNDYVGVGVELFTEHYLNVDDLSGNDSEGYFNWSADAAPAKSGFHTGWIPDALVPFSATQGRGGAPFDISANQNQGVWVDIYVDKDLPAGTYTGTITVTENGNTVASIPLSLEVMNFTLPDENHYHAMVFMESDNIANRHGLTPCSPEHYQMLLNYYRMAHRHRIDLINCFDRNQLDDEGMKATLDGSAYTPANGYEGPGEGVGNKIFSIGTYGTWWSENQSYFETESDAWVNWFDSNAPDVTYFLYLYDEPGPDVYDEIQTKAGWIHNNPGPGHRLPVFVTEQIEDGLIGAVDIWCMGSEKYVTEDADQARARGEKVWVYSSYRPRNGADTIDTWSTDRRIKPWVVYRAGLDNVWFTWESAYWRSNSVDILPSPKNVWVEPITFQDQWGESSQGNGDGTLFYPGEDKVFPDQDRGYPGPISSIRMKAYRRGIQDYEYMWLAEQAGKGAEVQSILANVLPHVMEDAVTPPDWSNQDYVYEDARRDLANLILGNENQPPSAGFSASPVSGTPPLTVNFTDQSIFNPTSWDWTFGDGGTSTEQNPTHTYDAVGTYTVSLTATNAYGSDTETKPDYISVHNEVVVYPETWETWNDVTIVSGSLSDTHSDDDTYLVTRCSTADQKYSMIYTVDTDYTPSDVSKITVEFQSKSSRSDTPSICYLQTKKADGTWQNQADWTITTDDQSWSWETTAVSTYMGSDGTLSFMHCACPSGSSNYDISTDVMRWRLELTGGGPQPPVADFSGNPTSGTAPLTVNFTDASSNSPTSWSWDFGDGGSSTAQNPSHEYTSAGDYTVSLTATNSGGSDTATKNNYISVSSGVQPPVADFVGSPTSGTAPLTVNFTDQSTNSPTSWSWDFGDGGTSTAQNPSHDYTSAGDYTVSLTATNSAGSDTATKNNYISVTSGGGGGTATVYPDQWDTFGNTSLVSGSLSDVQSDNQVYMKFKPDDVSQGASIKYFWNTSYTPDDITKITYEWQYKGDQPDTPTYLIQVWKGNYNWDVIKDDELMPTTDTTFTWETTDVSTYLDSNGTMGLLLCTCPQNSTTYNVSCDLVKVTLTLK